MQAELERHKGSEDLSSGGKKMGKSLKVEQVEVGSSGQEDDPRMNEREKKKCRLSWSGIRRPYVYLMSEGEE